MTLDVSSGADRRGVIGEFRPDGPPVVRAQLLACDGAAGRGFDRGAVDGRWLSVRIPISPSSNLGWVFDSNGLGQPSDADRPCGEVFGKSHAAIVVAHATELQVAFASVAFATVPPVASDTLKNHRIERLKAFIEERHRGNVTASGRALGYKDGAFIRQVLAGTRQISEKTYANWAERPELNGWFESVEPLVLTDAERRVILDMRQQVAAALKDEIARNRSSEEPRARQYRGFERRRPMFVSEDTPPAYGNLIETSQRRANDKKKGGAR